MTNHIKNHSPMSVSVITINLNDVFLLPLDTISKLIKLSIVFSSH